MIVREIKEYSPAEEEEYMSSNQLAYFRKMLVDWRCELVTATAGFALNLKETTMRKPDPVDQSTTNSGMALDVQTRNRQQNLIRQIDYALSRIDEGEYGYCEITGEPIGLRRLLARPIATMCIDVQENYERLSGRHVKYMSYHV